MKPLSGIDLFRSIRYLKHASGTPIVLMTSNKHSRCVEAAREAGATHFLIKPFIVTAPVESVMSVDAS